MCRGLVRDAGGRGKIGEYVGFEAPVRVRFRTGVGSGSWKLISRIRFSTYITRILFLRSSVHPFTDTHLSKVVINTGRISE